MFVRTLLGVVSILGFAASVEAASVDIAVWNCNAAGTYSTASSGTGTSVPWKGVGASAGNMLITQSSTVGSGSVSDPSAPNKAIGFGAFAAAGVDNGLRGARFNTSTGGYTDIAISFDLLLQRRASRNWQLLFTSDGGATWAAPTSGTGTATAALYNTSSATISNTGRISIASDITTTVAGSAALDATGAPNSFSHFTFALPSGSSYENASGFGFVLAEVFDTTKNDFVSTATGQTTAESSTDGYSNGAGGSQIRMDMITVTGVPEPTSLAATGVVGVFALRRRNAK